MIFISSCGFKLLSCILYFCPKNSLYCFSRKGLLVISYLSFCLYGHVLIFPSSWRIVLLDIEFLVDSLFFQHSKYVILLLSHLYGFDEKTHPLDMMSLFSLHSRFSIFSFQQFDYEISKGIHWASLMQRLIFFIKFGTFSAIISGNILSAPFFLRLLSCIHWYVLWCL